MFIMPKINLDVFTNIHKRQVLFELMDKEGYLVVKPNSNVRDDVKYYHHIILKNLYSEKRWTTPVPGSWYMPHISSKAFVYYEQFKPLFDYSVNDMINSNVFY